MRILYLGNNWLGWQVLQWLRDEGEEVVGLVLHPEQKQQYAGQIREAAALPEEHIFDARALQQEQTLDALRQRAPDVGLSVLFGYILRPSLLALCPEGVVNLHPSYLPYNRGVYPNVWSIVEGTPAGTTLHYIDEGVDTGDIIAQREVPVEPVDTGETLYRKLEGASLALFKETWPLIRAGNAPRLPQPEAVGTFHRTSDVAQIDPIDLDQVYTAEALINILRARTFPPHKGAYFEKDGRRIYMRIQLEYGEQTD